jgi:mannose-1-phosphate guanylyltransferase
MFKSIQNAFKQHAIEILELFIQGNDVYNTNSEVAFIAKKIHLKAPNFYRLCYFRKGNQCLHIPADIGWSDLGTYFVQSS